MEAGLQRFFQIAPNSLRIRNGWLINYEK